MKILTLLIAGMLVFALCACNKTETIYITPEPTILETPLVSPEAVDPAEITESTEDVPEYVINVYYGDENAENILHEGTIVNDLSPQVLLDKLFEKGVFSETVTSNSFTVDNYNVIHLDLSESFAAQLSAMGTSGEHIMLGSLANTFIDAFDADGLALSVDGNILETGHNIYDYTIEFFN